MKSKLRFVPFGAIVLLAVTAATRSAGAVEEWDNGGGDFLWSTAANWNPDGTPAANDIVFTNVGTAASGTVTSILDASTSINTINFTNIGGAAAAQTIQINSGQTLTISGTGTAFNVNSVGSSVYAALTNGPGAGAFAVTGGATANFLVGSAANTAQGVNTFDMAGLSTFTANVGAVSLGNGLRNAAIVSLAATNSITATSIAVGGNTGANGATTGSSMSLGKENVINTDALNIGNGRNSGSVFFRASITGGTLTISNRAGTGGGSLTMGALDTSASAGPTATADFSPGTLTASFSTITLGRGATSTAGGSGTGRLIFGPGTITATNVYLGNNGTGSSSSSMGIGDLVLTNTAGNFTATTMVLGRVSNVTAANGANGTFSQYGGTSAITTITVGDRTNTTTTGNSVGTVNLFGGLLKAQTIQAGRDGTGGGTVTRSFNWTGGTIRNLDAGTDLAISGSNGFRLNISNAGSQTFFADSGRNIAVQAVLAGNGGFTKSGSGTLVLSGANTYTGTTSIDAGKLVINGDNSAATGNVTIAAGAMLGGNGTIGGATTVNGIHSPGNSPGVQTFTNGLTYNTGSTFVWELTANSETTRGTDFDGVNVTGAILTINTGVTSTLVFNGTGSSVAWSDAFWDTTHTWLVFSNASAPSLASGSVFDSISVGLDSTGASLDVSRPGSSFAWQSIGNDLYASYAIPEPSTYALLGLAGAGALVARWRKRRQP